MAPRGSVQRRQTQSQNEHVFALGKVGRKTGITIPDNGRRDEHGFEELDNLFSSPDRELLDATNGRNRAVSEDEQDEQDMEIDDGSELGPATTRKLQQGRPSLPRARSPIKTNLKSPARQNPHIPPTSSPTRGTVVTDRERTPRPEVKRRLDFSKSDQDPTMAASSQAKATTNGHYKPHKIASSQPSRPIEQPTFSSDPPNHIEDEPEEEDEEDEPMELLDAGAADDGGYLKDDLSEAPDEEVEAEEEEEPAPIVVEPKPTNKSKPPGRRGRKPKTSIEEENDDPVDTSLENAAEEDAVENEEPVKKRKGRPKAASKPERVPASPVDPSPPPKASKRGRQARTSSEVGESSAEPRDTKRQKTSTKASKAEQNTGPKSAPAKEKAKPGRKRKSSGVGVDSPVIQRGPPLPKSRGLVTVRREETSGMRTTRSGRASFKPLEWWKGEHVEYDEDQENLFEDANKRHFKMRSVKGVVRTEESEEPGTRRRGRPAAGRKPGRRPSAIVEEIEREDWELDPGRVAGEVFCWLPEYELEPPGEEDQVELITEELAISENALQLKDIKDATFKFAKTLTLPFFGAGVVDLPPRAQKRLKNSRMRHLAFFVHTGNVTVTIAQTEFGIAKGGMFFVPRGNYYEIVNETDRPARMFFAQGCEVLSPLADDG
ncbi:Mif2/CENP-C like-domain-containing protein [Xylaria arbuscula]|nr:Mif2/CENP-C like-domain-containing protein [Xylaria arbuscula]